MLDLILAVLHHLAILSLILIVGAELALIRGELTGAALRRLAAIDLGFGIAAGAILVIGIARVMFGAKGWVFYAHNPWFWAKIGGFLLVGLLSIHPTTAFLSWRRQAAADAAFRPPADLVGTVRRAIIVEAILLGLIVACAAAMARFGSF
jgi:putative membrane protein